MAEGEVTRQAEQDIEADGENAKYCELLEQIGIVRADGLQDDGQAQDDGGNAEQQ